MSGMVKFTLNTECTSRNEQVVSEKKDDDEGRKRQPFQMRGERSDDDDYDIVVGG